MRKNWFPPDVPSLEMVGRKGASVEVETGHPLNRESVLE